MADLERERGKAMTRLFRQVHEVLNLWHGGAFDCADAYYETVCEGNADLQRLEEVIAEVERLDREIGLARKGIS